jgi:uncharacterized membrane protein YphA (DoxX/SURF4 family)
VRIEDLYARLRGISLTPLQRISYTRTAVVLGFAGGFLLSHRLWINSRSYPLIPIFHGLPAIKFPLDYICAGVLYLLLWSIAIASKPRANILSFAALLVVLALYDQSRWQPWVYLYLFILLALSCFSGKEDDVRGQENALNICRLILGATYFYSGLQKMNHHFATMGAVGILGPRAANLPLPQLWPWVMAVAEVSIAVGLLTRRYRNLAVLAAVGMHSFILFSCIVILPHWNSVIWPWNLTMIAFLVLLFWNADFSFGDVVWRNPLLLQKAVLVLFGILPFLSFFGLWDSYLSASLYSANVPEARVVFRGTVKGQLPGPVRSYAKQLPAASYMLDVGSWSMGELNVPPYPAMRVYRALGAAVCKYSDNSPDVALLMRDKDTWLREGKQTQDTCLGTLVVDKW